eukprot:GHVU01086664.1.p1 GENE.GHVU01086664.1~~GHVU01086664.1.p1  ORF type:complete len:103 (-),score=11.61 GHVU01086664.1:324-632(-)
MRVGPHAATLTAASSSDAPSTHTSRSQQPESAFDAGAAYKRERDIFRLSHPGRAMAAKEPQKGGVLQVLPRWNLMRKACLGTFLDEWSAWWPLRLLQLSMSY